MIESFILLLLGTLR